jgi:hypothetical protein
VTPQELLCSLLRHKEHPGTQALPAGTRTRRITRLSFIHICSGWMWGDGRGSSPSLLLHKERLDPCASHRELACDDPEALLHSYMLEMKGGARYAGRIRFRFARPGNRRLQRLVRRRPSGVGAGPKKTTVRDRSTGAEGGPRLHLGREHASGGTRRAAGTGTRPAVGSRCRRGTGPQIHRPAAVMELQHCIPLRVPAPDLQVIPAFTPVPGQQGSVAEHDAPKGSQGGLFD